MIFGIEAHPIRAQRAVHHRAVAIVDVLQHDVGIERVVDRLAQELVVERFHLHIHAEKIHAKADYLLKPNARMLGDAVDVFDGHVADQIRLPGQQSRHARRFFLDAFDNHLADLRLGAPVIVVAPQHQVAAALPAHVFVRPGAGRGVVQIVAVFLRENKPGLQPREQKRIGTLGRKHHRVIVGRFHLDALHVGALQTALVVLQFVDGERDVLRGKRRAVVKAHAFAQMKNPLAPLKLPRLSEHADVFIAVVIHLDQRLDDVAPDTRDAAAAVAVGMERVQTDALINDNAIFGCRPRPWSQGRREEGSQSQSRALPQELAPIERSVMSTHRSSPALN